MQPLALLAAGMVTGVGLDAPSSCAAIRAAVDNFAETRFMDRGGEWIIGSEVPLEEPWRGRAKLARMAAAAARECLDAAPGVDPARTPLLLCVAERERPGRVDGLDDRLFAEVETLLGVRFDPRSAVIPLGRVGGAAALTLARRLVAEAAGVAHCLVVGVDGLLVGPTLDAFEARHRVLTSRNSDGFIPGEAAGAVLVSRADAVPSGMTPALWCVGLAAARETATLDSDEPFRAEGLAQALRGALADAGRTYEHVDYRLTGANGEQYWFKEAALALGRTMRVRKARFDLWHPADCIGEVGAAAGPCALGVAMAAARKGYAPGRGALAHFSADDGARVAVVLAAGDA